MSSTLPVDGPNKQRLQSFVMTKICYQALPMAQFTTLQKKVFPAYFRIQVGLVVLTAVTFPTKSVLSLARAGWVFWVPLGTNFGMAALDWLIYGPRTQHAMVKRTHQGKSGLWENSFRLPWSNP